MDIQTLSQEIKMRLSIPGAVVTIEEVTTPRDGIKITVTDKNGTSYGYIYDGEKGEKGDPGTTDYNELTNKPAVNGTTLADNKTASELGLANASDLANYETTTDADTAHSELTTAINNIINDLNNYYTKSQVDARISAIPKFTIEVVQALPTEDISPTTVYLLTDPSASSQNLYIEYIYVNGGWEQLGTQSVDLSNYYTKTETNSAIQAARVTTNNDKKLTAARRQALGNAVYVALIDEDNAYNNVYGLPSGATAGAYLSTPDTSTSGAAWTVPDTTPAAGSAHLITSGGVYAAIQSAITDALNASY